VKIDGQAIDRRFRVSEAAMREVLSRLPPGWSGDFLQIKFASWASSLPEPLRLPVDKAFAGWAPGFTKNQRP
jgi:hypothetical protein